MALNSLMIESFNLSVIQFNFENYNVKSVCLILMNRDTGTEMRNQYGDENKDIICHSKREMAGDEVN